MERIDFPGWQAQTTPRCVVFKGQIYAWYMATNDDKFALCWRVGDGRQFGPENRSPFTSMTINNPEVTVFQGFLYISLVNWGGEVVLLKTYDLQSYSSRNTGLLTWISPPLVEYENKLCLFYYTSSNEDDGAPILYYTVHPQGLSLVLENAIGYPVVSTRMAAIVIEGRLYLYYNAVDWINGLGTFKTKVATLIDKKLTWFESEIPGHYLAYMAGTTISTSAGENRIMLRYLADDNNHLGTALIDPPSTVVSNVVSDYIFQGGYDPTIINYNNTVFTFGGDDKGVYALV